MTTVSTPFGSITVQTNPETDASGALMSCVPGEACPLNTPLGTLVPQYEGDSLRKRQTPVVSFYPDGMLKVLPLQEQTLVPTPLGPMPAEQVILHEDGSLKRVFPLNAKLSGFWTQDDETALAVPMTLDTPLGSIQATLVSAYFSPSGALRSLTLWPGTEVQVPTPAGPLNARMGIAFRDDGTLKSLEPAAPVTVPTPLGELAVFDPDAVGISGDANSLNFAPDGTVCGLATVNHVFNVAREDGKPLRIAPILRKSYCDGETPEPAPLFLAFADGKVTFSGEGHIPFTAPIEAVTPGRFTPPLPLFSAACGMNASFM